MKEGALKQNKRVSIMLSLLAAAAAASLASLFWGSTSLNMGEVLTSLLESDWDNPGIRIFLYVRLPRTFGAMLCGSALAVAGAVLQVVLNNSLAGPNIIGVNAGAGFSVLLIMALFPASGGLIPAAAFFGALFCTLLIYVVARSTGASRMTIVLAGVAVSSVINAASSCIKILVPDVLAAYNTFSIGTLDGVTMSELKWAAPYIFVGLAAAILLAGNMNVLMLGEEIAQSLGLRVEHCRLILLVTASLLAGAAVSFAGLIGFVGLLVPHIARILFGSDNRLVVPGSALLGGIGVLVCDLIGRTVFAPFEIHVGILLSLIGGCYFICLLLRKKGGKLHG